MTERPTPWPFRPADCDDVLVVAFAVLTTIAAVAFRGMQKRRRERVSVCRR